jgi:endoglucanase
MALDFRGISFAGAEFGEGIPGKLDTDYWYPLARDAKPFLAEGINLVRIPFRWERLQRQIGASLHAPDLNRLRTLVDDITAMGATALLDLHNYGEYREGTTVKCVGRGLDSQEFADVWARLATAFQGNASVMFGLMNEPRGPDDKQPGIVPEAWVTAANAAVQSIRRVTTSHWIVVGGVAYSGAWSWSGKRWDNYGTPNASAMKGIQDPEDKTLIEVHQYIDSKFSGKTDDCSKAAEALDGLREMTAWLRANGRRGLLGEFGVPQNGLQHGQAMLDVLASNSDAWAGWCWWAVGQFREDYVFRLERNGQQTPQFEMLKAYCR